MDPDFFDGTFRRTHAIHHPGSLECGSGRASTGEQPVLCPEHDFTIRSDVDEEGECFVVHKARSQHTGTDIRSHIGSDAGQAIYGSQGVNGKLQFARTKLRGLIGRRDVRAQADRFGWKPQEQMDHRGVSSHGYFVNAVGGDARPLLQAFQKHVQGLAHQLAQLGQAIPFSSIDDARDDILSTSDLPVIFGRRGANLSAA